MHSNRTAAERLDARTTKTDFCWIFANLPSDVENGYGRIRIAGRIWKAHRLAYALAFGPIPEGLNVLHTCDNPPCVRLDHLYLGSAADNADDRESRNRHTPASGEQHGRSKLTWDEVREIRRRSPLMHRGYAALAREYGVSDMTIRDIVLLRKWHPDPTSAPA